MSAKILGLHRPIDDEETHRIDANTRPRVISLLGNNRYNEDGEENPYITSLAARRRAPTHSRRSF